MSYVKCSCCGGRKEIMGLGTLQKTCPNCKGTGYEEFTDETVIPESPDDPVVKRRGRKPKLKDEEIKDAIFT